MLDIPIRLDQSFFRMAKQNSKKKSSYPEIRANAVSSRESLESSSRDTSESILPIELGPGNVIVEQNEEMNRQDKQLVDLEASILNLRDASVSINQEVSLQSGLLDSMNVEVDRVQGRQTGMQERLRGFMQRNRTCKLWFLIALLGLILVFLLVVLK